jgi:hypothetical protein
VFTIRERKRRASKSNASQVTELRQIFRFDHFGQVGFCYTGIGIFEWQRFIQMPKLNLMKGDKQ